MNFDFRPIEKEYPKAFAVLKEWITKNFGFYEIDSDGSIITDEDIIELSIITEWFNDLELHDFFDEQRIYGIVNIIESTADELDFGVDVTRNPRWYWEIHGVTYEYAERINFPSRHETRIALWAKEFQVLEEQL